MGEAGCEECMTMWEMPVNWMIPNTAQGVQQTIHLWGGIMVLEVWQRDRSSSPALTKKSQKEGRGVISTSNFFYFFFFALPSAGLSSGSSRPAGANAHGRETASGARR